MLTKQRIEELLRENYPRFAAEYGVKKVGLFGSYAKGVPGATSDVDLIVEFDRPIGLKFIDFAEELETLLGRKVDLLTRAGLQGIRIERVAEDIAQSVVYV
ncbi:MAG TPA: nucleotidyltransferase family protein [Pyrinomonadaceae bacterium]|nr:nucleotidyltransferase family protein [Pyrinomonadaceae bacterium]